MPIAHGEGRFTTKDKDLIHELRKNDQIAFSYSDGDGTISEAPIITPNGSLYAIAGICNPAGNVVALMPHPERTPGGAPYFASLKRWIESGSGVGGRASDTYVHSKSHAPHPTPHPSSGVEIFIDTIIVNNEERTVEQALHRVLPTLKLRQYRYMMTQGEPGALLRSFSHFNPNKEVAYIRRGKTFTKWNSERKTEEALGLSILEKSHALLRRDEPDTGAHALEKGSETGICYVVANIDEQKLYSKEVLEIFGNPHASTLEVLQ